jgi:hypothetical protein
MEDARNPWEAITGALGDRLLEDRRVALGPGLDPEFLEVAAQGDETPPVAGLGQDAFVGREAAGADTGSDQATAIGGREPDEQDPGERTRFYYVLGETEAGRYPFCVVYNSLRRKVIPSRRGR